MGGVSRDRKAACRRRRKHHSIRAMIRRPATAAPIPTPTLKRVVDVIGLEAVSNVVGMDVGEALDVGIEVARKSDVVLAETVVDVVGAVLTGGMVVKFEPVMPMMVSASPGLMENVPSLVSQSQSPFSSSVLQQYSSSPHAVSCPLSPRSVKHG